MYLYVVVSISLSDRPSPFLQRLCMVWSFGVVEAFIVLSLYITS